MSYNIKAQSKRKKVSSFHRLTKPLKKILKEITPFVARGNRYLQMTFEDQLNALINFHLEEHASWQHLVQVLKEDEFAKDTIAPKEGIEKSSCFEAINTRGSNSYQRSSRPFTPKLAPCFQKSTEFSMISRWLTAPSLMPPFPCTRPTIGMVLKKPRSIQALISTSRFHPQYSD